MTAKAAARATPGSFPAGIPEARIIHLGGKGSGLCLEHPIEPEIYTGCANGLRAATRLQPTKTDIASRLIDIEEDLLAADKADLLALLHVELSDALQIPPERRPNTASK